MQKTAQLADRTAIVTGAGRGIGRAIARRLAAAGCRVALIARTTEQVEETCRLVERAGGTGLALTADVSIVEDVERLVDDVQRRLGTLDFLVNNAGTAALATIDQMDVRVFDGIIAANVRSVYLCSRAVWPIMAGGKGGTIVNISSVAAHDPFPGFAAYGASKAFVNTYTKALAAEGASCGIRLYGIAPGAVETQMLRGPFPDYPADKTLDPDEVAALVETLLLPGCRHVSGEILTIEKT